ncbi:MAG: hypothetical protein WDN69_34605 [Aliidongia sp.]
MSADHLVPIPVLDADPAIEPAVASAQAEPARLALLIAQARRSYTPAGLRLADARSRSWAARSASPYAAAVGAVEQALGGPGAFLLNYSYEWGCTTGAADDPALGGATLLRTLDWPFDGLGRALMVVRQNAAAGRYLSVTWPGYVGVLTGLAPGRFAAAINQPPLPLPSWGRAIGWLAARLRVGRSTALPPSHLLRLAFDTCRSFAESGGADPPDADLPAGNLHPGRSRTGRGGRDRADRTRRLRAAGCRCRQSLGGRAGLLRPAAQRVEPAAPRRDVGASRARP